MAKSKSDELLTSQYMEAVAKYGEAVYQRDQLSERIQALRAQIDRLQAAQPVCNQVEQLLMPVAAPEEVHTVEGGVPQA